jgi:alpha-1,3-mannosyltransferase
VAALRHSDLEWRLTIAGYPSDLTVDAVQSLVEIAGIRDAVEIIPSPSDASIRNAMATCSVWISASEYEGFGIAAVEGMSAGLFPVLSDIRPFRQLVARTGDGLIVDFADPESAAARFVQMWPSIAANHTEFRELSMKAVSDLSWTPVTQAYQFLYEQALGNTVRTILGVGIRVSMITEAVRDLDARVAEPGAAAVVFANANTLNIAASNVRLLKTFQTAIVFNDGIGVDFASLLLFGKRFPQNLNGTDFVPHYLVHTGRHFRVFLLGSRPGVAILAAQRLATVAPQHEYVGCHDGYWAPQNTMKVIAEIRASQSEVLLVAMGSPLQELWLMDHLAETGCRLGFGVGGLFDFLSGQVPRAPEWMRTKRIEWMYRILIEPRRLWRRYTIGGPAFIFKVFNQWISGVRVADGTVQASKISGLDDLRGHFGRRH